MKWRFRPIWLKSPFCFAYFAERFCCLWKSLFQRFSGGFCLTCIVKNNVKSLCSFCIFIITFDVGKNWISCFCTGEFIKIYLSTLILAIFVQRQQRNVFLFFYWIFAMFIDLSAFDTIVSTVGIFLFLVLTAYDVKKIQAFHAYYGQMPEMAAKASIFSALQLYLDFINLFVYIMRILGRRK